MASSILMMAFGSTWGTDNYQALIHRYQWPEKPSGHPGHGRLTGRRCDTTGRYTAVHGQPTGTEFQSGHKGPLLQYGLCPGHLYGGAGNRGTLRIVDQGEPVPTTGHGKHRIKGGHGYGSTFCTIEGLFHLEGTTVFLPGPLYPDPFYCGLL